MPEKAQSQSRDGWVNGEDTGMRAKLLHAVDLQVVRERENTTDDSALRVGAPDAVWDHADLVILRRSSNPIHSLQKIATP